MLSPNPTTGSLKIDCSGGSDSGKYLIFNSNYSLLESGVLNGREGNRLLELNSLPSGVHYFSLQVEGQAPMIKKFVKIN